MPIYAFECATCGHGFERLQRLSDADPSHCPECAAEAVVRQLTAPQFRLAGGGWYETDFKKDGDRKRNLAGDGGGDAKAGGAGESKPTEAKSESRSDTTAGTKPAEAKPASTSAKAEPAAKPAAPAPAASSKG